MSKKPPFTWSNITFRNGGVAIVLPDHNDNKLDDDDGDNAGNNEDKLDGDNGDNDDDNGNKLDGECHYDS